MEVERLTYHVSEAAAAIGISRAKAYLMIASGELPHVRLGGRVLVPIAALRRLVTLDAPAEPTPPTPSPRRGRRTRTAA